MNRNYFFVFVLFLIFGNAMANPIRLSCKFSNGTEMLPFNVDLQKREAYWTKGYEFKVIGDIEKFLTIRSPDNEKLVGGMYMVIDRFTGEFTQTNVSLGTDGQMFGGFFKGICNIKRF